MSPRGVLAAASRPAAARDAVLALLAVALDLSMFSHVGAAEQRVPAAIIVGYAVVGYATLMLRRRAPMVVFAVLWVHSMVALLTPALTYFPIVGMVVAIFSVAEYRGGRSALGALVAYLAPMTISIVYTVRASDNPYGAAVACTASLLAYGGVAWTAGRLVRVGRQLGEASAREAIGAERLRIARELHDVVAHSVTVMVLQSAGAQRIVATDPPRAGRALGAIEEAGKQAMDELRRMLRVLRADDHTDTEPLTRAQPGLADLEPLVAGFRAAGVRVRLRAEGTPGEVTGAVSLTAYRVVQEALTNVTRYARPGARTTVVLAWAEHLLLVKVTNDGPPAANPRVATLSGGYGLRGLRERVDLAGGQLTAEPVPGGGFEVTAALPVARPADVPTATEEGLAHADPGTAR
ncbi:sensor histidine kinase [Actinomycetes bacterium KLBMP 9797]